MTYIFNEYYIPDRMMDGLDRYFEHGIEAGGFLMAVLSNDLMEAVGRADSENMRNLPAYCGYLYNECNPSAYGSKEKVKAWMEKKAEERAI